MADERYERLLAENAALRARIAELERQVAEQPSPEPVDARAKEKSYGVRKLDPNHPDRFMRPAFSRRPT